MSNTIYAPMAPAATVTASVVRTCLDGEPTSLERTRFFPRQLVAPDDLTQDQVYFRGKLRRHNRMLHGWGVVCGARCQWKAGDCTVLVEAGYILGPYGDEIVIPGPVTVDLCKQDLDGNTFSGCGDLTDPWCKDVRATRKAGPTYYLAVRYDQCMTRPVSVPSGECGCGDGSCENTRISDSYVIQVLDRLPDSYATFAPPNIAVASQCDPKGGGRPCAPCPSEPWVILADFTLSADGTLANLDCFAHRRYVISYAGYFFACAGKYLPYVPRQTVGQLRQAVGLLDLAAQDSGATPAEAAAVRTPDGTWTTLPIYYTVRPGETLGTLLASEGDRQYYDLFSGDTYSLRELYALSGARPDMPIASVQDAVRPLEGLRLDVPGMRVVQGSMAAMIGKNGMSSLDAGALGNPAAAPTLQARDLQGVDPASSLGQAIAGRTIAEVANMPQADFVRAVTAGVAAADAPAAEAQARDAWMKASRVVRLSNAWKG